MLLVADQAMPNVLCALAQLGSQSKRTFFHFNTAFPIDVVSLRRADCLSGELCLLSLPYWVFL
jgi:hypothetical protein